jgi:hypothetical protein
MLNYMSRKCHDESTGNSSVSYQERGTMKMIHLESAHLHGSLEMRHIPKINHRFDVHLYLPLSSGSVWSNDMTLDQTPLEAICVESFSFLWPFGDLIDRLVLTNSSLQTAISKTRASENCKTGIVTEWHWQEITAKTSQTIGLNMLGN